MGWRIRLAQKNFNKAKSFVKEGARRLDEVGEKAKPHAVKAAKKGSKVFNRIADLGDNVNYNIERQASNRKLYPNFFTDNYTSNRKSKHKRKNKRSRRKKKVVITYY